MEKVGQWLVAIVFVYFGIGLSVAGVRLLLELNFGGLILVGFGTAALVAGIRQIREANGSRAPGAPSEREAAPRDPRLTVRVLRAAGFVLFVVGAAGFLSGFFASLPWAERLDRYELPLGHAQGLAVDRAGRVYVGSRAYNRIHRYGADGSFQRAWHVDLGKGLWQLAVGPGDPEDRLELRIGGDRGARYALVADRFEPVEKEAPALTWQTNVASGPGSATYTLRSMPLRVVREANGGAPATIVDQGWLLLLVTSPLPAWIFAAVGMTLLVFLDGRWGLPERSIS